MDAHEIKKFADWILQVGDDVIGEPNGSEATISIPSEFLITEVNKGNLIASIVHVAYPDLLKRLKSYTYFEERAMLAPTHDVVDEVNEYMLSLIPGEEKEYYNIGNICKDCRGSTINDSLYSSDYLNSIRCSGLPNHILKLKVGTLVMLLRNIVQSSGSCNGTRFLVTKLGRRIIEGVIISGSNIGTKVPIPRMLLSPSDSTLPFKFQCRQFPIIVCNDYQ